MYQLRRLLLFVLLPGFSVSSAAPAHAAGVAASPVSTRSALLMDRREAETEELAGSLLGLSGTILDGDEARASWWLATGFEGDRIPGTPGAGVEQRPGISRSPLTTGGPRVDAASWTKGLLDWSRELARVEDARFDVLEATASSDGRSSNAKVRVRIQGVTQDGGRRALTASTNILFKFEAERWKLAKLELVSGDIQSAVRPPFLEVAVPAGVSNVSRSMPGEDFSFDWQGACSLDMDGDGWIDLFVPSRPTNHLYRNKGDGTFEEVSRIWGVDKPAGGTGALALDYDNDGRDDLLVCGTTTPIRLFKNDGKRFLEVGHRAGVDVVASTASAAAADYDGDGNLDVFVACYKPADVIGPDSWHNVSNGRASLLFRNKGDGTFEEVAHAAGLDARHFSFAAAWADYDDDGKPDLAVANDYGDKSLYHNLGGGKFEEVSAKLGVLDTGNGMGVDWADVDGDGKLDLFFANMTSVAGDRLMQYLLKGTPSGDTKRVADLLRGNALFRFDGQRFQDVRADAGVADAGWAWGGGFFDADSDGSLDLFVTNGMISGVNRRDTDYIYWTHIASSSLPVPKPLREIVSGKMYVERHHGQVLKGGWSFAGHQRDHLLLNSGAGKFVDVSPVSGCDGVQDGRSAVFADFDNDGRKDIFVHETMGRRHRLYANAGPSPARFVSLSLIGVKGNRAAVGARVSAALSGPGGQRVLVRTVMAGSGYASSGDRRVLLPVPAGQTLGTISINWPGGAVQKLEKLPPGSFFTVREGEEPKPLTVTPARLGVVNGVEPLTPSAGGLLDAGDRCPDLKLAFVPGWTGGPVRLAGKWSMIVVFDPAAKDTAAEILALEKIDQVRAAPKDGNLPLGIVGLMSGPAPAGFVSSVPFAEATEVFLHRLIGRAPRAFPIGVLVDPDGQIFASRSGRGCAAALERLVTFK